LSGFFSTDPASPRHAHRRPRRHYRRRSGGVGPSSSHRVCPPLHIGRRRRVLNTGWWLGPSPAEELEPLADLGRRPVLDQVQLPLGSIEVRETGDGAPCEGVRSFGTDRASHPGTPLAIPTPFAREDEYGVRAAAPERQRRLESEVVQRCCAFTMRRPTNRITAAANAVSAPSTSAAVHGWPAPHAKRKQTAPKIGTHMTGCPRAARSRRSFSERGTDARRYSRRAADDAIQLCPPLR
jgi:hypothetical protein